MKSTAEVQVVEKGLEMESEDHLKSLNVFWLCLG